MKKLTEHNSQKIFFGVFIFSVILAAFGFLRTGGMSQNITDIIGISDSFQDYYLLGTAFSLGTWLFIIGMFFIPKNWLVYTICIIVLLPQLLFIVVSIGYSYTFLDILKNYIFVLSFGTIILK